MKKIMMILAVLVLVAACTPAQDVQENETTNQTATEEAGELGEQVENVNIDDLNVSELDDVGQDLEDFNW